jgi:hypothetical protein
MYIIKNIVLSLSVGFVALCATNGFAAAARRDGKDGQGAAVQLQQLAQQQAQQYVALSIQQRKVEAQQFSAEQAEINEKECSGCWSKIDDDKVQLGCGHSGFHGQCLSKWLSQVSPSLRKCPLCQAPIIKWEFVAPRAPSATITIADGHQGDVDDNVQGSMSNKKFALATVASTLAGAGAWYIWAKLTGNL